MRSDGATVDIHILKQHQVGAGLSKSIYVLHERAKCISLAELHSPLCERTKASLLTLQAPLRRKLLFPPTIA